MMRMLRCGRAITRDHDGRLGAAFTGLAAERHQNFAKLRGIGGLNKFYLDAHDEGECIAISQTRQSPCIDSQQALCTYYLLNY